MANAQKCRAADDLLMSVETHPQLADARRYQAGLSIHQLRRIVLSQAPLQERALALWLVLGTDRRPSRHLVTRQGEPAFVFDLLDELGTPGTMVEIAREGFRRTREVLCPFVGLLMTGGKPNGTAVVDDELPDAVQTDSIPGWALDIYTREGRTALNRFSAGHTETAHLLRKYVAPSKRIEVLGSILFRIEGGLLARRFRWSVGDELRRQLDVECHGLDPSEAAEALRLMRSDLPALDEIRSAVTGSRRHDF